MLDRRPPRRGPAVAAVLAVLALLLAAPGHAQQPGAWTLAHGANARFVPLHEAAGFAALPVTALEALGFEVTAMRGGVRLVAPRAEIVVRDGSPFVHVNGQVRQLVHAPYDHRGTLHVPVQFVVDLLPSVAGTELAVDLGRRSVRRTAATAAAQAPAPRAAAPAPRAAAPSPGAPVRDEPAREAPAREAQRPAAAPARSAASRRLVVIDAGHGGVDPGAVGPGGVREKDVTLAVARRLAAMLREDPTLEVRMTRDRDTLVALADRGRMANRWRGEGQDALFMSIHTNAHDRGSVRGFETFFLSDAKTEDARRVAEMENAAQRYESPTQRLDPLSFMLHDLRQNKYLRDSSDWAAIIQDRLAAVHPGPNRGVKQAGFVVLNGAFMPAVLVELGFITHPDEARMLADAPYQDRMARQLAAAVKDFFAASPSRAGR